MSVHLNHTIVHTRDNRASAEFLGGILGLVPGETWGPFVPLDLANGVTLDFVSTDIDFPAQHYAFLVSEAEFDGIFARITEAGVTYYPSPRLDNPGHINRNDGGRGMYFLDPNGHAMEVITKPYGG
ncbi:MAG: VOC family protein [Streptomycetaceae bacterium]|uniref:VOC family protein n=1 Tax=Yinghuangia aomiensis TaxID=676205 RepID=A0ABP9HNY8_9ACTN|nr:VOC family protein [Streptomycetaceae bacterium]NUS53988.1 VOC family protein [Streptomycetaceae bacterium]